ncbi:hypothetical protein Tco_0575384 [Tanacetum coccineum]
MDENNKETRIISRLCTSQGYAVTYFKQGASSKATLRRKCIKFIMEDIAAQSSLRCNMDIELRRKRIIAYDMESLELWRGLFNIPEVTRDAVMLHVFPFTLIGAAKRWVDRLTPGTINTWDLLKKTFIQRTSNKSIGSISNSDGLAAIVSKLDNLGRDMKKLKENIHVIQVGCQICEGPYLDKDCPLNEEVKQVKEVKYREFGRPAPFNGNNGAKFHVGPPGYYTHTDNRLPYGEKRPSLEELMIKHQEESARQSAKMEEWIKKL